MVNYSISFWGIWKPSLTRQSPSNSWSILEQRNDVRPVWGNYWGLYCWCPTVPCIVWYNVYYGVIRVYCIVCNSHQYNFNKNIYSVDKKVVFLSANHHSLTWIIKDPIYISMWAGRACGPGTRQAGNYQYPIALIELLQVHQSHPVSHLTQGRSTSGLVNIELDNSRRREAQHWRLINTRLLLHQII